MKELPDKIAEAKKQGYSDIQIVDYLAGKGYGDKITEARKAGHDYSDIVRHLSGEKRGVMDRIGQGAASFYLGTRQMADAIGSQLGDIEVGTDGIRVLSPDQVKSRSEITNMAAQELNRQKGDAGLGAELLIAAGNPVNYAAPGLSGGLFTQGAKASGLYEFFQPQEQGFSPVDKAIDTTVSAGLGGAGTVALGGAAKAANALPGVQIAKRGISAAVAPFTTTGARARAANRVQGLSASPETAISRMEEPTIAQSITPAKRSGDQGLIGLEQAARAKNPEVDVNITAMDEAARRELSGAMGEIGSGSPSRTTDFISGRRDALIDKLEQRAQQAGQKAQERISALSPERRASEASVIAREEMESALKAARATEGQLWEKIPNRGLTTSTIRNSYRDLMASIPKAQRDDIPTVARKFLDPDSPDKFRNIESAKELQGLRSKLLDESRAARSAGEYNKARIADGIADSILDDLGAQSEAIRGPVGAALREALDYSRGLHQTYHQGSVGRILRPNAAGGDRVAPEMTLESVIGAGRTRGDVAATEMLKAANTPAMRDSLNDYMLNRLQTTAFRGGEFNPQAAKKFLQENQEIFGKIPEMKKSVQDAITAQEYAIRMGDRSQSMSRSLMNAKKSRAAEFLNAPVDKEFDRILASKDPASMAKQIRVQAMKDSTGEAVEGLKAGVIQSLMRKASTGFDASGNPILSGSAMRNSLNDPRTSSAIKAILSPEEFNRLGRVSKELQMLDTSGARVPGDVIRDAPNRMIEYFGRALAARSGAKWGGAAGGSLQTAGMASSNAKQLMGRLTNDKAEDMLIKAITDDDLFKILLSDVSKPQTMAVAEKRLNNWLSKNAVFVAPLIAESQQERGESSPAGGQDTTQLPTPEQAVQPAIEQPVELPQSSTTPSLIDRMTQAESGGDPNARNPNSSASGPLQFTNDTWTKMVARYGRQTGISLKDKNNPDAQRVMGELLMRENGRMLTTDLGREPTEGELYVAHFLGAPDATKLIKAQGTGRQAITLFPKKVVSSNRSVFFDGNRPRTVEELYELITSKVA